jgi:hypothetical protein
LFFASTVARFSSSPPVTHTTYQKHRSDV